MMLLALTFANPLLLGGLALVVAPVIIHWLSRRRYQRRAWAAMQFLREAEQETRRRMRLSEWLLLLLRCLAIALLALLVARPFLANDLAAALAGGDAPVERFLVIDDSASTQVVVGGATRFEALRGAAEGLAAQLIARAAQGPLTTLSAAQPSVPRFAVTDPAELPRVRRVLAEHEPTPLPVDVAGLVDQIAARVEAIDGETRLDVYLFTDAQQSDWGADRQLLWRKLAEYTSAQLRIIVVRSDRSTIDNRALRDVVEVEPDSALAGRVVQLSARLASHGAAPAASRAIELALDDRPAPLAEVSDHRQETLAFVTPLTAGSARLRAVVTPGDALPLDDVYHRRLDVRSGWRVLLVNGDPQADPRADEAYLMRRALNPPGPFASGIEVVEVGPSQLSPAELAETDVVILANPAPPPSAQVAALRDFVESGGGLAVFLGANAQRATTHDDVWNGLMPATIGRVTTPSTPVTLRGVERHPVMLMFPPDADTTSAAQFRTFIKLAPLPREGASAAQVLARFTDAEQSPAVVATQVGAGRVVVFAAPADLEWSNWPAALDGSYVVTLLQMVTHLAPSAPTPTSVVAGSPLEIVFDARRYGPRVEIRPPNYPATPAEVLEAAPLSANRARAVLAQTTQVGFYDAVLTRRSGAPELLPVGVNVDPRESDLTLASDATISAALGAASHLIVDASDGWNTPEGERGVDMWAALVLATVAVLMSEQFLAWRMGRQGVIRDATRSRAT